MNWEDERSNSKAIRAVVFSLSWLIAAPLPAEADPEILWKIVNNECVPDQEQHASAAPCSAVNISEGLDRGFAVLKDDDGSKPHAYLLIPTRRLTGIEEPALLEPSAPNYFEAAWTARSNVIELLKVPLAPDMLGLAVNSAKDRTQNQLHIHIDCVRSEIRDLLKALEDMLASRWSELNLAPPDHPYMAMKIEASR